MNSRLSDSNCGLFAVILELTSLLGHHSCVGINSSEEVGALFKGHGVSQVYVKKLAPKQDNEKNQIYLGSGLDGATNLFPATIVDRSPSESTEKRNSSQGKPKVEAQIDLAWRVMKPTVSVEPR